MVLLELKNVLFCSRRDWGPVTAPDGTRDWLAGAGSGNGSGWYVQWTGDRAVENRAKATQCVARRKSAVNGEKIEDTLNGYDEEDSVP